MVQAREVLAGRRMKAYLLAERLMLTEHIRHEFPKVRVSQLRRESG